MVMFGHDGAPAPWLANTQITTAQVDADLEMASYSAALAALGPAVSNENRTRSLSGPSPPWPTYPGRSSAGTKSVESRLSRLSAVMV